MELGGRDTSINNLAVQNSSSFQCLKTNAASVTSRTDELDESLTDHHISIASSRASDFMSCTRHLLKATCVSLLLIHVHMTVPAWIGRAKVHNIYGCINHCRNLSINRWLHVLFRYTNLFNHRELRWKFDGSCCNLYLIHFFSRPRNEFGNSAFDSYTISYHTDVGQINLKHCAKKSRDLHTHVNCVNVVLLSKNSKTRAKLVRLMTRD